MAQDVITRTIQGVEAPVVGTWEIDPNHTTIGFVARYIMVTKVRGHFKRFSGAIHVEEKKFDFLGARFGIRHARIVAKESFNYWLLAFSIVSRLGVCR